MSDLIDRQAAIDAIEEYSDRLQMVNWQENPGVPYKAYALNWAVNTIRDLPSAHPEQRWISMADKHPDDGQRVLMQFINGTMHVLPFSATGLTTHIAAWMPLPKPWEGGDEPC